MTRNEKGQFERRAYPDTRPYRLMFDDGSVEFVQATTPSEAVRNRMTVRLPHTITDMKAMAEFGGRPCGMPFATRLERVRTLSEDAIERPALTFLERVAESKRERIRVVV